jgi:hypothetical protein
MKPADEEAAQINLGSWRCKATEHVWLPRFRGLIQRVVFLVLFGGPWF